MIKKTIFIISLLLSICKIAQAQEPYVYGTITDLLGNPIPGVHVTTNLVNVFGTVTDNNGYYKIFVPAKNYITIRYSFMGFKEEKTIIWLDNGQLREVNLMLEGSDRVLKEHITYSKPTSRAAPSVVTLDKRSIEVIPSAGNSIASIIKTLPSVTSNNELSSQYSVRGGNFDENLIYVNDFEIYRPFLIRSGQQEGLGFINPDLIQSISFSAGGFEAKYGDKMSSVLDVRYKRPIKRKASISLSMLGWTAHLEGSNMKKDTSFTYIVGVRNKTNRYILNALPTTGQYRPSATDFQTFLTFRLAPKLQLEYIGNYARNVFQYIPQELVTSFGTFNEALELRVAFDGQERDEYSTFMSGLALRKSLLTNDRMQLKLLSSVFRSSETEAYDIIAGYLVGEVEKNLGNEEFGDITRVLGVGTYQDWARNRLGVTIANVSHRGYWDMSYLRHFLTWGAKYQHEQITDEINEWYRLDSAGYNIPSQPEELVFADILKGELGIESNRYSGFVQDEWLLGKNKRTNLTTGVRFSYWDINKEFLVIPRMQLAFNPRLKADKDTTKVPRDWTIKLAAGMYHQPPFYREMRNQQGVLNTDLKAQKSAHFVLGSDYDFGIGSRQFKLTTELYYKHLWDLVPYDLENVLIRYFGQNSAKGYAAGLDMRLFGDFVPGTDSWISLSVMQTQEDLDDDHYFKLFNAAGEEIVPGITDDLVPADSLRVDVDYVARPTDQRVTFGMFFQDYLPNNENFKMHLSLLFGTGFPFSPSNRPQVRNLFRIPPYRRVDIGFSALLFDSSKKELPEKSVWKNFNSVWASLEVFNLLGVSNTISYSFVQAQSRYYAVPNYLTARRVNARLIMKF